MKILRSAAQSQNFFKIPKLANFLDNFAPLILSKLFSTVVFWCLKVSWKNRSFPGFSGKKVPENFFREENSGKLPGRWIWVRTDPHSEFRPNPSTPTQRPPRNLVYSLVHTLLSTTCDYKTSIAEGPLCGFTTLSYIQ